MVFSTISVATLSVKACLRAAAMFTISNEDTRQTKSSRAGLLLHVGKMHRWMTLVKVGKFVHEMAAIYLRFVTLKLLKNPTICLRLWSSSMVA